MQYFSTDSLRMDKITMNYNNNDMKEDEDIILLNNNVKTKRSIKKPMLNKYYDENPYIYEIGVDEAGRGPLFGRVYSAAVILPKDDTFDHSKVKDSKKFHSKKNIDELANYIK